MILQELNSYYERLLQDDECDVPVEHWSTEKVAWEIMLAEDGRVAGFLPLEVGEGKGARRFVSMQVPEHTTRTSAVKPFFLCDSAAYLLGLASSRGEESRQASRELHEAVLAGCEDAAAKAVCAFFGRSDALDGVSDEQKEALAAGGLMVFGFKDDRKRAHEHAAIKNAWTRYCNAQNADTLFGQCAVTGEEAPLARLFPQVTGIPGAQSAGASLVSFNKDSFESYGKKQAYNASISESVAFNAGSALKYLYADPKHHVRFGQMTVVFWTDRPAPAEEEMMRFIIGYEPDTRTEDGEGLQRVKETFERMKDGMPLVGLDTETRFFVLGIAPNAARLSVRFFETDTFGNIARHYGEYLRDIEMVGVKPKPLRLLLRQTAPQGEADAVPAPLYNGCFRAMLTGTRFPQELPRLLAMRMRVDHGKNNSWDVGQRAALMKACLVRDQRPSMRKSIDDATDERSLLVALNKDNPNQGYVLGRLFAIMEKAQRDAVGDVNATIRERYIGVASSAPSRVFQPLLLNYEHHIGKLRKTKPGLCVFLETEFNGAMKLISAPGSNIIPATLSMNDQINFFVGYHQQAQELWKSRKANEGETNEVVLDFVEEDEQINR